MALITPPAPNERLDGAAVISVICTTLARGRNTDDDPIRIVKQYWSIDGTYLAENDPYQPKGAR